MIKDDIEEVVIYFPGEIFVHKLGDYITEGEIKLIIVAEGKHGHGYVVSLLNHEEIMVQYCATNIRITYQK